MPVCPPSTFTELCSSYYLLDSQSASTDTQSSSSAHTRSIGTYLPTHLSAVLNPSTPQNGLDRKRNLRRGRAPLAHQVPLAGLAAQFLVADHADRLQYDPGCERELHHGAAAASGWNSLVRSAHSPLHFTTPIVSTKFWLDGIGRIDANSEPNRYFSYWITVSSLAIVFLIAMLWLISQRQLLPGIVIMGTFIQFILWIVGLIVVSIELWGPTGSVNSNCQLFVSAMASSGPTIDTLAYLEQHSICTYHPDFCET